MREPSAGRAKMKTVSVGAAFARIASASCTVPPTVCRGRSSAFGAPLACAAAIAGGVAGAAFCATGADGGIPASWRASLMLVVICCTIGESAG